MRKIALKLKQQSAGGVITLGRGVKDGLSGNSDVFPSSPVTIADLNNAITELQDAQTATLLGGKPEFAARDAKRLVLEGYLKQIAHYVEGVANGNVEIMYLAGMTPAAVGPHRYDSLATPLNLRAKNLLSGQVGLRWKKVPHAKSYQVEYCLDPMTADGWKTAVFNSGTTAVVTGLTPVTRYWFRVRALGTESTVSEWSDVVMMVVA